MPGGNEELDQMASLDMGDSLDDGFLDLNESASMEPDTTVTDTQETEQFQERMGEVSTVLVTPVHVGGNIRDAHRIIQEKKNELLNPGVTDHFIPASDGERLKAVKDAIMALNQELRRGDIPKERERFVTDLDGIRRAYSTLIQNCRSYLEFIEASGNGDKGAGKFRLDLTRQIMEQSEREYALLEAPSDVLYEDGRTKRNWEDMFDDAKPERIPKGKAAEPKDEEKKPGATAEDKEGPTEMDVASSRIAKELGMEEMVADAELSKKEGEKDKGSSEVVVENVSGMSMQELMDTAQKGGTNLKLSDEAIGMFYQMQVFDMFTGMKNRTLSDCIPTFQKTGDKEYTITSIKAINNEASFEENKFDLEAAASGRTPLTDLEGKISVPFLPGDFYDRVMSFDAYSIFGTQKDILDTHQMAMLGRRVMQVQIELSQNVGNGNITLLNSERDWNEARDDIVNLQKEGKISKGYLPIELL